MESPKSRPARSSRGAALTFVIFGTAAIVFGGLFSAATARSASYHSAWVVAYLVLVVGIAQIALGLGQWLLSSKPIGAAVVLVELVIFNLGNAGVILGTVLATTLLVDVGSAFVVISLAIFAWAVWSPRRRGSALWAYWVLVVLLAVSVLVGLYFAHSALR